MPLFVYLGHDGPRGAALRTEHRPQHLAHLEALSRARRIRFAGPLLNDRGDPCGSLIIFEATDLASARALAESDPYMAEGIFESIDVFESKQVFPE